MDRKNIVKISVMAAFFLATSLWTIFAKTPDYSESERRVLAGFPDVEAGSIVSGKFADEFEKYATERFPGRDVWRSIKAYTNPLKDNHGIYTEGKHLSKMEYPMHTPMLDYAVGLFDTVKEAYLQDNPIYLAVVPDKNRYLAGKSGHLKMDYEQFSEYVAEHMSYAEYIEIADLLEADDYYNTDTHWRQDKIVDVAQRIANAMGTEISTQFSAQKLERPFYGVYAGQSALKCKPDTITYLTNPAIGNAQTEGAKAVYDMEKHRDPYEMFLSGNQPVVTIKNPGCSNGKRLIMFRDSFGSGIAPLLIDGYAEIILVDLRYIPSSMLAEYVNFENADILFLYSTILLNNSKSMNGF